MWEKQRRRPVYYVKHVMTTPTIFPQKTEAVVHVRLMEIALGILSSRSLGTGRGALVTTESWSALTLPAAADA